MESFNDWLFVNYGVSPYDLTDREYDDLYDKYMEACEEAGVEPN